MGLFDVDPMTDLGVYTYSEVFDSKIRQLDNTEIKDINADGEEYVRKIKNFETAFDFQKRK
jgi:hypothetical protein